MTGATERERFEAAVADLGRDVEADTTIVAAILFGSVSYAQVWERSDIDLMIVVADGKKVLDHTRSLLYRDAFTHAFLRSRTDFIKEMDGGQRGGFGHHMLATGRVLFSRDPAIDELFSELGVVAGRDRRVQLFNYGCAAAGLLTKASKWFHVRDDVAYSALWLVRAAEALAGVEVYRAGHIVKREVLDQALDLNPALFTAIYVDAFTTKLTRSGLEARLRQAEDYLIEHTDEVFGPLLAHLAEEPGLVDVTDLGHELSRRQGLRGIEQAAEWLADHGRLQRAAVPVRLTRTSKTDVDGLAVALAG